MNMSGIFIVLPVFCIHLFTHIRMHTQSWISYYIFNSQLNTSGREPTTCDTPASHSIDISTEELKVL